MITCLYFVGKGKFPTNVQTWFWNFEGRPWWVNVAAAIFGISQYYYLFIAVAMVLVIIAVIVMVCLGYMDTSDLGFGESDEHQDDQGERALLPEQRQQNLALLGSLSRYFDKKKFNDHTECSICMVDYETTDQVTPLPCDKRHYFHSECIERWS